MEDDGKRPLRKPRKWERNVKVNANAYGEGTTNKL